MEEFELPYEVKPFAQGAYNRDGQLEQGSTQMGASEQEYQDALYQNYNNQIENQMQQNKPVANFDLSYKGTEYSPAMQEVWKALEQRDALLSSFYAPIQDLPKAEYDFKIEDKEKYWQKEQIQQKFKNPETGKPDRKAYDKYFATIEKTVKKINEQKMIQGLVKGSDPLGNYTQKDYEGVADLGVYTANKVATIPTDKTLQHHLLNIGEIYNQKGEKQKYSGNTWGSWDNNEGLSYMDLVYKGYHVEKGADGKPILKEASEGTDLSMKDRLGYFGVSRMDEADYQDILYYPLTGAANGVATVIGATAQLAQMASEITGMGLRYAGYNQKDAAKYSGYNFFTNIANFESAIKLGKYDGNEGWSKFNSEVIGNAVGFLGGLWATRGVGAIGVTGRITAGLAKLMTPATGKIVTSLLASPSARVRYAGFVTHMSAIGSQGTLDALRESGIDIQQRGKMAVIAGGVFAGLGAMDDFMIGGNTGGWMLNKMGLLNSTALLKKNMVEAVAPLKDVINAMTAAELRKFGTTIAENTLQKTIRQMANTPLVGRALFEGLIQEPSETAAEKLLLQAYNNFTPKELGRVKKEYTEHNAADYYGAVVGGLAGGAMSNITSRAKEAGKLEGLASIVVNDAYYEKTQKILTEQADDSIRNKKWLYSPIDIDDKGDVIPQGSLGKSANATAAKIGKENLTVLREAWETYKKDYKKEHATFEGADEAFAAIFKDAKNSDNMYSFLAGEKFEQGLASLVPEQDNEMAIKQMQDGLKTMFTDKATTVKREFFDKVSYVLNGGNPENYKIYNTLNQRVIKANFNNVEKVLAQNPTKERVVKTILDPTSTTDTLFELLDEYDTKGKGLVNNEQQDDYDTILKAITDEGNIIDQNPNLDPLTFIQSIPEDDGQTSERTQEALNLFATLTEGQDKVAIDNIAYEEEIVDENGDVMVNEEGNPLMRWVVEDDKIQGVLGKILQNKKKQLKEKIAKLAPRKNVEKDSSFMAETTKDIYFDDAYSMKSLLMKANAPVQDKEYSMQDFVEDSTTFEKYAEVKEHQLQYNYRIGKQVNGYLSDGNEGDLSPIISDEQVKQFKEYIDSGRKALEKLKQLAIDNESNFIKDNFNSSLMGMKDKLNMIKILNDTDEETKKQFEALQESLLTYEALIGAIDPDNKTTVEAVYTKQRELFQLVTAMESAIYKAYQRYPDGYDTALKGIAEGIVTFHKTNPESYKDINTMIRVLSYLQGITKFDMPAVNGKIIEAVDMANSKDPSKRFFPSFEQLHILQNLWVHTNLNEGNVLSEAGLTDNYQQNTIMVNGYNGTGKTKLMELFAIMMSGKIKYYGHSQKQNENLQKTIGVNGSLLWGDVKADPTLISKIPTTTSKSNSEYYLLSDAAKMELVAGLKNVKAGEILIIDEHTLSTPEALTIVNETAKEAGFKVVMVGDLGQASKLFRDVYTYNGSPRWFSNATTNMTLQQRGGIVTIRKLTDYFRGLQQRIATFHAGFVDGTTEEDTVKMLKELIDNYPSFYYQEGEVDGEKAGISIVNSESQAKTLVGNRTPLNIAFTTYEDFVSIMEAQGSEAKVVVLNLSRNLSTIIAKGIHDLDGTALPIDALIQHYKTLLSAAGRAETHLIIIDNDSVISDKMVKLEGKVSVFKDKLETRKEIYDNGLKTLEMYRTTPIPTTTTTTTETKEETSEEGFSKFTKILSNLQASKVFEYNIKEDGTLVVNIGQVEFTKNWDSADPNFEGKFKKWLNTFKTPETVEVVTITKDGGGDTIMAIAQNTPYGLIVINSLDGESVPISADTYIWKGDNLYVIKDDAFEILEKDGKPITKGVYDEMTKSRLNIYDVLNVCKVGKSKTAKSKPDDDAGIVSGL